MKQHYPLDPVTGIENPALAWANGNPATGTNGSYPPFGLFLDPQKEILAAQRAGGLSDSADGSDTAQLSQSISRGTWLGTLGQSGTVNDLTAALPGSITWPQLLIGMEFSGVINAANTGAMTVTLAGFGTAPGKLNLVGKGGGALKGGDVPGSVPFKFKFDGSAFRLTGGAASETIQNVLPYTPAGSRRTWAFTPNVVLSDMPNVSTDYVAQQTPSFTGASYAKITGSCSIANDNTSLVNLYVKAKIVRVSDNSVVWTAQFLGGVGNNSIGLPFSISPPAYQSLDPAQTYVAQLVTSKTNAFGPVRVLDGYILAETN